MFNSLHFDEIGNAYMVDDYGNMFNVSYQNLAVYCQYNETRSTLEV